MAFLSLLEGDATLVMERFLLRRLPACAPRRRQDLAGARRCPRRMPDVPPVLRDQLVLPYLVGPRLRARRCTSRAAGTRVKGGLEPTAALDRAGAAPGEVLRAGGARAPSTSPTTPARGRGAERRRAGRAAHAHAAGTALRKRPSPAGAATATACGTCRASTLLVWRSVGTTPADAPEFLAAAVARASAAKPRRAGGRDGFDVFAARRLALRAGRSARRGV